MATAAVVGASSVIITSPTNFPAVFSVSVTVPTIVLDGLNGSDLNLLILNTRSGVVTSLVARLLIAEEDRFGM